MSEGIEHRQCIQPVHLPFKVVTPKLGAISGCAQLNYLKNVNMDSAHLIGLLLYVGTEGKWEVFGCVGRCVAAKRREWRLAA